MDDPLQERKSLRERAERLRDSSLETRRALDRILADDPDAFRRALEFKTFKVELSDEESEVLRRWTKEFVVTASAQLKMTELEERVRAAQEAFDKTVAQKTSPRLAATEAPVMAPPAEEASPPKWGEKILSVFMYGDRLEEILGDLAESYTKAVAKFGSGYGKRRYACWVASHVGASILRWLAGAALLRELLDKIMKS